MFAFYLNFIFFALVASITPGPSNLLSLMIGARWGAFAAVPFILGASISAALILWLSGMGLDNIVAEHPMLKTVMEWGGVIWMTCLAWRFFFAGPIAPHGSDTPILGWKYGAGMQVINPKTWMMAFSVVGIFALPDVDTARHFSTLAVLFFLVAVPCLLCWSYLGQSLSALEHFSKRELLINKIMAVLLLVTVWSALFVTA